MFKLGTVATAAVIALAAAPLAAAADLPIGDPINEPKPALIMSDATYRLLPMRVADPDGGPPWAMATYLARPAADPARAVLCTEYGRVVADQLGMVTADGTFRPFVAGGSPSVQCGGVDQRAGARAAGWALRLMPAKLGTPCALPTAPIGRAATAPSCDVSGLRTIISTAFGPGIIDATLQTGGRSRRLPLGPDGTTMVVLRGLFTDATVPSIIVRARGCGPNARPDLRPTGTVVTGCVRSFAIPSGPRPAKETAASRRARRAKQLNAATRVIERRGSSAIRRFRARVLLPITVTAASEGYAYRLRGPGGARCTSTRLADTTRQALNSYEMIAGRRYDLPLLPLGGPRARWCPGNYRLQIAFVRRTGPRLTTKIVATTTFTAVRH